MARESGMDKGKDDDMKDSGKGTQGGTHEQHVKAGQQSHKNSDSSSANSSHKSMPASSGRDPKKTDKGSHTQGGTHEQHVKSGQQSHKNTASMSGMDDEEPDNFRAKHKE